MCARLHGSSGARTGQGQSYLCCASHPIPGCRRFLLYIYMGVSLARSYREVSGKTEYFHELVTEPAQLLEVLSEDLPVRCVMVLHEDEAIPTWIHKKARTRLVCVTRTRVTTKKVSNHVITSL